MGRKRLGRKVWGEVKNNAVVAPKGDTAKNPVGLPGSKERIEAYRQQYQLAEGSNESVFNVTDNTIACRLADTAAAAGWDFEG